MPASKSFMAIRILSTTVAAQIAAGEVIERPASVVKELLENALDAGASTIHVDVHGAGQRLIRLRDNGHGIPAKELSLALQRHATSKLQDIGDLSALYTLGFRGEALHSIASICRMTLTSRHRDEEVGARIVAEGGEVVDIRGIGAPVGTVVEVADLFYNVPARRKFLKSDATERRHIVNVVSQYAMAYPDIRLQLNVDGREMFHSTGSGELSDVLVEVLGLDVFREMVEVVPLPPSRPDLPPVEVYGYTTLPSLSRSNRSQIHLFVNGRSIVDQRLTFAVVQAYHTLLPGGRYPMAVIMIQVPPEDVDVNVHPTKAEVRFRAPDAIFSAIQRAVRRAVIGQLETPAIDEEQPYQQPSQPDEEPERAQRFATLMSAGRGRLDSDQLSLDLEPETPGRYTQQIDDEEALEPHYEAPMPPHLRPQSPLDPTSVPDGLGKPQRPRTLPILRVVGQVSATYIIAEGPAGMYLIDQHAAHERILYEQFVAAFYAQEITVQHVLETVTVELGQLQARLLEEHEELLATLGFEVETFGKNIFRIKSVPAMLADRDPGDVLLRLLEDVERGVDPGTQDIEDKIVRRICKAAAVKAGQILSYTEMEGLLRQLERCETPHTCPHGRPTLIHLSRTQLEKQFGRT